MDDKTTTKDGRKAKAAEGAADAAPAAPIPPEASTLLPSAAVPGANTAAVPPLVDAARVDEPGLARASEALVEDDVRRRMASTGIGAGLPPGVGETSIEPGASMPHAAAGHAARLEALADAVLPPARSPVFPAGADPAGAILEGHAGAMQSAPLFPAAPLGWGAPGQTTPPLDGGAVRIIAKRDGFRRAGIAHPAAATDYPAGAFSAAAILAMEIEPMLVVQRLETPAARTPATGGGEEQFGRSSGS